MGGTQEALRLEKLPTDLIPETYVKAEGPPVTPRALSGTITQIPEFRIPEFAQGKEISLEGQVAIVTGGGSGIGKAIALKLARHGADVTIVVRGSKPGEVEEVAEQIRRLGRKAHIVKGDVAYAGETREEETDEQIDEEGTMRKITVKIPSTGERAVKETEEVFGKPVSILVNVAGTTADNLIGRMTIEQWRTVVETKLTGTFLMTKAVASSMIRARKGRIINITSISGLVGNPAQGNYGAANEGVVGFTRAMTTELGPKGITVNAVAPGWVETPMTSKYSEDQKRKFDSARAIPLAPYGNIMGEDVANITVFLASEWGRFVSGQTIPVDAGTVRR